RAERLDDRLEMVLDDMAPRLGGEAGAEDEIAIVLSVEIHAIALEIAHGALGLLAQNGAQTRIRHYLRGRYDGGQKHIRAVANAACVVWYVEGADLGDAVEGRAAAPELALHDGKYIGAAVMRFERGAQCRSAAADDQYVGPDLLDRAILRHA